MIERFRHNSAPHQSLSAGRAETLSEDSGAQRLERSSDTFVIDSLLNQYARPRGELFLRRGHIRKQARGVLAHRNRDALSEELNFRTYYLSNLKA